MTADPVIFTLDDGSGEEVLAHPQIAEVSIVNYLSFGSWLFVPEGVTNLDAFDFAVFAGGDDPFMVDNLERLAGTAGYEGVAAGMYAKTGDGAMISPFNAKVALTADSVRTTTSARLSDEFTISTWTAVNPPPAGAQLASDGVLAGRNGQYLIRALARRYGQSHRY
jgi:hypothetical protein